MRRKSGGARRNGTGSSDSRWTQGGLKPPAVKLQRMAESSPSAAEKRKRGRDSGSRGVTKQDVPKAGEWVIVAGQHAQADLERAYQGACYCARVYKQKEGYVVRVGELPGLIMIRPTKEEAVGRMTHYLPAYLHTYFAFGRLPPLPSLPYAACPQIEILEDPSQADVVEDIDLMVDFTLPPEEEVFGTGLPVKGVQRKKATKVRDASRFSKSKTDASALKARECRRVR